MENKPSFAARVRVSAHRELEKDFIQRVLELPWAFISDGTSLFDFVPEFEYPKLIERTLTIYGVDISDIGSGNVADILDRIAASRTGGAVN